MRLVGRRGRAIRRALFAAAAALGGLGALEIGARALFADDLVAAGAPPPAPEDGAPTMRGNPYLLWEYAPGWRFELGVPVHINALGLRGDEPQIPAPEGTRRLLATGDSSIYGYGVADDEVFLQVAAAALSAPGAPVEGWNAAIPGYSTFQSINLLQMRALALEPDVVVVGNLWSDNNFDAFVDRDLLSAYSRWDRSLVGRLHGLLSASALYRVMDYRVRVAGGAQAQARKVGWTVGGGAPSGRRRVSINDYAANLDTLVSLARGVGAEVIFLALANREDLGGRGDAPGAWAPYREVFRDAAARAGAPVVSVPEVFRASGLGREALFLDEMHPTAEGHALMGRSLAGALAGWAAGEPLEGAPSGQPRPEYSDPYEGRGPLPQE